MPPSNLTVVGVNSLVCGSSTGPFKTCYLLIGSAIKDSDTGPTSMLEPVPFFWGGGERERENVAFQNGGQINQLTILWDRRYKERGGFSGFPPLPYLRCCLSPSAAVFCPLCLLWTAGPLEELKGEMNRHLLQLAH